MKEMKKRHSLFIGILLIIVGVVVLLQQVNFQSEFIETYLYRWEAILILIGVLQIAVSRKIFSGIIAMGVGIYFMMDNLTFMPQNWEIWFFPVILILGGIAFIFAPDSPYCSKKQ
ncbi:LiaF transmembrane domain-containing protein [Ancylomarina longa]|uniref:LiaF transmembrane domain-containing protein n=1 Tax=Ancylomarina longa TaxID=2487017 RepID=A0A434AGX5_9BACT|nr:DUF5668 domain-containing protein [Ancylomarina longa]RUT73632.1 hypothetical protein DLK05_12450 [Ancylomarina longa]